MQKDYYFIYYLVKKITSLKKQNSDVC